MRIRRTAARNPREISTIRGSMEDATISYTRFFHLLFIVNSAVLTYKHVTRPLTARFHSARYKREETDLSESIGGIVAKLGSIGFRVSKSRLAKVETMKYFVLILFVSLAFASDPPPEKQKNIDAFINIISRLFTIPELEVERCVRQTGLINKSLIESKDLDTEIMEGKDVTQDENARQIFCVIACSAQVHGSMIGNKINMPFIDKLIDTANNRMRMKSMITGIMHECYEIVQGVENECDVAGKFIQCVMIKTH